jgi:hypothetical protein
VDSGTKLTAEQIGELNNITKLGTEPNLTRASASYAGILVRLDRRKDLLKEKFKNMQTALNKMNAPGERK